MKFLEIADFAQLNSYLDGVNSINGDSKVFGRIEAYSCINSNQFKKILSYKITHSR